MVGWLGRLEMSDGAALQMGGSESRAALAIGTARLALMATISGWLSWRGFTDRMPGDPLYNVLFDLLGPLVFSMLALVAVWLAIQTGLAFTLADRPRLVVCDRGISAPQSITRMIDWADLQRAWVWRAKGRARLVLELAETSQYYLHLWPFWPVRTVNLWVEDPDAAEAAIYAHPQSSGLQVEALRT